MQTSIVCGLGDLPEQLCISASGIRRRVSDRKGEYVLLLCLDRRRSNTALPSRAAKREKWVVCFASDASLLPEHRNVHGLPNWYSSCFKVHSTLFLTTVGCRRRNRTTRRSAPWRGKKERFSPAQLGSSPRGQGQQCANHTT